MISTALAAWRRIEKPSVLRKRPLLLMTIGAVAIGVIFYLIAEGLNEITAFPVSFTLCALSSTISLITFVFVIEVVMGEKPVSGWALWVAPVYIMLYAVGVFLPLTSVMFLAGKIVL